MPSPESLELARLYFRKRSEDLAAAQILNDAASAADAVIGFHAQQSVEKFAKAVLVAHGLFVHFDQAARRANLFSRGLVPAYAQRRRRRSKGAAKRPRPQPRSDKRTRPS